MLRRVLFFLVCFAAVFGKDTFLYMRGYLDRDLIRGVEETLEEGILEGEGRIIVQVNSSSGDLTETLRLAERIYDLKMRRNRYVIVYIQGKAVGPAAILPFVADKVVATPLVAWGDIPYGVKGDWSSSKLKGAIFGMISPTRKDRETLSRLVDAMIDPNHQVMVQGAKKGEGPLVLNLKGMESLGVVDQVLTDNAFATEYVPVPKQDFIATGKVGSGELTEKLKEAIPYDATGENLVGYLHIGNDRPIDISTYIYVKFALKEYVDRKVKCVILDLNTPGGEVLSALKIVDLLQHLDVQEGIPVIAFVHDWAVSAGAMLAYACRFIAAEPQSLMGAAEPVYSGEGGQMVTASEKVNSALRAEFANLASFYGRNPLIAEAMVDKEMTLVLRNHKVVSLMNESEIISGGSHPDVLISGRGKLLTLTGGQMMDLGVADFMVPLKAISQVTDEERSQGTWPAKKNLVFQEPYLAGMPDAMIIDYHDWKVVFFTILTHPVVAMLLFVGLIVGFYIEINTPGFGIPGSIALGCLVLVLISSFASHAVSWLEVIILTIGIALLVMELFIIPGFGVVGILGIILTIIGLFALMLPGISKLLTFDVGSFSLMGETFMMRIAWLFAGLLIAILVVFLLARFCSHKFFRFSKLVLKGEQEGYVAGIPKEAMPEVGEHGVAESSLRPSGKVFIGDHLYDGVTLGGFIEKGTAVEIVKIEGSKVVVQPLKEHHDPC